MAQIDKIQFVIKNRKIFEIDRPLTKASLFTSPSKGRLSLSEVVEEIARYFEEKPKERYKVIIGTDSDSNSAEPGFVSAVVIQRIGRGGIYFYRKHNGTIVHNLREKIYFEVNDSLDLARELVTSLRARLGDLALDFGPEIHIDVGENGPTKDVIKEVVNTVLANGFEVKCKPESFAASNVADKYT